MKQVRVTDLKSKLSEHLRSVESGEIIEVTARARPIARVVPIAADGSGLELIPAARPFSTVRTIRLPPCKLAMSSLSALRLERGPR